MDKTDWTSSCRGFRYYFFSRKSSVPACRLGGVQAPTTHNSPEGSAYIPGPAHVTARPAA